MTQLYGVRPFEGDIGFGNANLEFRGLEFLKFVFARADVALGWQGTRMAFLARSTDF
jgi:hypothetical protein